MDQITANRLKQIGSIDIFKFIMSLFVILLHVPSILCGGTSADFPPALQMILAYAVPYFFISSGFLTARKISSFDSEKEKDRYLRNRIKAIFKVFLLWIVIYLPLSIISLGDMPIKEKVLITVKELITRGHPHLGWPLWYLYSLLLTLCFVYILRRRKNGLLILLLFYLITSFIVYESEFSNNIWIKRIGFYCENPFGGGLSIIIGFITYYWAINSRSDLLAIFLILLSIGLFYFELPYFPSIGGWGLFIISLRMKISYRRQALYNWARTVSMWNYYIHIYIIFIIHAVFSFWGFTPGLLPGCLICLCLVVIAANILYYLGNIPYFSKIKRLLG